MKTKEIDLARDYLRDEENRIIINMNVSDDSNFLSVFSKNEIPVISTDVAEFLEASTYSVPVKEELTLRIKSNCIDENEQTLYEKAIKEYYKGKFIANQRELKRNHKIALFLALFGVMVLAVAVFLEYSRNSRIWAEVVDIMAWVFLWESVDMHFFKTRELTLRQKRYHSFISMKIEYL